MHIVEIRRRGGTLAGPMAAMRTWLDVHRVEPKLFQFSIISAGVIFSLQFQNGGDAAAFARAFGGEVIGDQPTLAA
ncbi:MAG TPA: hypothetical protein VGP42_06145 [Stellaceae bacterium]|jgi:hypothetical protein|nr:hypothetical protein [Stellaceae bacterium]